MAYLKPYTEVVVINNETLLTETSFPGQHKPARRKTGPTANNAKQESEWLEVGENVSSSNAILHCVKGQSKKSFEFE